LRALFGAIKSTNGMSFVVVQHLAPTHRSRLVELIAQSTTIPVRQLKDGVAPEVSVAYITPPNRDVFYENGVLRLRAPHAGPGPMPSIDLFLSSLAEHAGELAIGVILSGTGSDGALGVRRSRQAAGSPSRRKSSPQSTTAAPPAKRNSSSRTS
jgi:two-component system CheB/CheR fusion protein